MEAAGTEAGGIEPSASAVSQRGSSVGGRIYGCRLVPTQALTAPCPIRTFRALTLQDVQRIAEPGSMESFTCPSGMNRSRPGGSSTHVIDTSLLASTALVVRENHSVRIRESH